MTRLRLPRSLFTVLLLAVFVAGCGSTTSPKKESTMYCGLFTKSVVEELAGHDELKATDVEVDAEMANCTVYDLKADRVLATVSAVPLGERMSRSEAEKAAKSFAEYNEGEDLSVSLADFGSGQARTSEYTSTGGQKMPMVSLGVVTDTHLLKVLYRPVDGRFGTTAEDIVSLAKDLDANLVELQPSAEATDSGAQSPPVAPDVAVVATSSFLSDRLG